MKQLKILMLGLALILVAAPALALGPLDANADLALNSKYVWRGMVINPDFVLQPAVSASAMGFGFGIWANMDLNDVNGTSTVFNEIDYTLSYGLSLPLVSFEAGLIYYDFPHTGFSATTELYVSASASVLLSPTLTIYQDLKTHKGAYWEAGVSHGLPLSPVANLDLSAGVGLGSKSYLVGYFEVPEDLPDSADFAEFTGASMCDFHISAGLPFETIPFFTVTPSVTYSSLLGDAKDATKLAEGDADAFFYGVTASFSF